MTPDDLLADPVRLAVWLCVSALCWLAGERAYASYRGLRDLLATRRVSRARRAARALRRPPRPWVPPARTMHRPLTPAAEPRTYSMSMDELRFEVRTAKIGDGDIRAINTADLAAHRLVATADGTVVRSVVD